MTWLRGVLPPVVSVACVRSADGVSGARLHGATALQDDADRSL